MRPALAYLFDECENEELQNAVRDNAALKQLRIALTAALEPADRMSAPAGDRGDNLILGLIALRLKFPRVDAEQKLERNLTLRDQR
ncbi:hypothetical protein BH24CHL4_BH24CHL4_06290 [soil metagenome]